MGLNLHLPENVILKPCITVFGVGGAGGNAVNNMINSNLEGAKFVVANTDAQALEYSLASNKIQLGENTTRGLGAGASPEVGRLAAEEAIEEIMQHLYGSNMIFITAGMGGGTGTGAAPVIARAARENGILTVGVVTKPFHFEGSHRMKIAESGLIEMQKYVDTLIVIPNQNLFRVADEKLTFANAFKMADDVLHSGVRGVTDLMIMPGLINLDFADIRAVMSEMGKAMMGTGEAEGEKRSILAAEAAISNPLLDHSSMKGARGVLINITGGADMTLFEVDEAANRIRDEVDPDANIIFGSTFNPELEGKIRISVVATGIDIGNMTKNELEDRNSLRFNPQITESINNHNFNKDINKSDNKENDQSSYSNHEIQINIYESKNANNEEQQIEENLFIPEPPIEPKVNPQLSEFNKRETSNFPNNYQKETEKYIKKPMGLLSRMASSVGLKSTSYDERQTENNIKKSDPFYDDELDIPAFLRKKK